MKNQDVQIASELENKADAVEGFEVEVVELAEDEVGAGTVFYRSTTTTCTTC
jgi:hypothetical protein